MRNACFLSLLRRSGLILAFCTAAIALPEVRFHAFAEEPSAAKDRLLESVKFLASDELEGRGVGTQGIDKAGEFLVREFTKLGLNVTAVNGQPFQTFELITGSKLNDGNSLQLTGPEGQTLPLKIDADFSVGSFGGSGKFSAEVVFCGYGIDAPNSKYSDFPADLDLTGKVLLVVRRHPQQDRKEGPFNDPHGGAGRHADLRSKISNAMSRKAAGVLVVNDAYTSRKAAENRAKQIQEAESKVAQATEEWLALGENPANDPAIASQLAAARKKVQELIESLQKLRAANKEAKDDTLMPYGYGGHGEANTLPALHITQTVADQMVKPVLKKSLADLEATIDRDLQPQTAVLTGWTVTGVVSQTRVRSEVRNVIAVLEGHGPHAEETVVLGAHYDHIGRGGTGSLSPGSKDIHNGADDNASGTAALLELARRMAARKETLPRRLVFIAFTGEELGLLGSARYVKEPIFPLEKTVAMLNMDMVGRLKDEKLIIYGTGTSPFWEPVIKQFNETAKFQLSFKPEGFGPSDHSSFYAKKIPVLHFFTGNHPDYHRPTDDWEKINLEGMHRVVDFIEKILLATVEAPERPAYLEVKTPVASMRSGNRPYVGTIPDLGSEEPGYAITGASPGSPAEKAGLKGGDRIVKLGANQIWNLDDFDLALRKFNAGDEVDFVIIRAGKELPLKVRLEAPK